jgi:Gpi18-like mannosyltransferase
MKIKTILKYLLIWQVLITAVVLLSANLLPLKVSAIFLGGGITEYLKDPLLNFRSNFDGVHYILIATHGYNYGQQAFFPLFPDLISFFFKYIRQPVLVGTMISLVSYFLALIVLVRLIALDYPSAVARWTVILLLFFPTSFFFGAVYTEGLFLLLVLLSFYSARKNYWLLAGIFGGLACYTRLVGLFLFPALLLELFWQADRQKLKFKNALTKALPLLLIPLSLLVYMYFLLKTTGDPLAFYHVQADFNQARSLHVVMPYQVFWRYVKMVLTVNPNDFSYLTIWLEFLTGIVFSVLAVIALFKMRLSYSVFSILAFFLPTFTGNFVSLPRYVLILFPLYILMAEFFAGHPRLRVAYLVVSGITFTLFLSMFARGYWVS